MASIASSCVRLSAAIIEQLCTAEDNDKEFKSLLVAVKSIQGFLSGLPTDGITPQGNTVLGGCQRRHHYAHPQPAPPCDLHVGMEVFTHCIIKVYGCLGYVVNRDPAEKITIRARQSTKGSKP